jgi:murein tripeptide amidase MpaA
MVNPEGVFEGMFRNDLNGENLNRLYLHCDPRKQYSFAKLVKQSGEFSDGPHLWIASTSSSTFTLTLRVKDSSSMEMLLRSF